MRYFEASIGDATDDPSVFDGLSGRLMNAVLGGQKMTAPNGRKHFAPRTAGRFRDACPILRDGLARM